MDTDNQKEFLRSVRLALGHPPDVARDLAALSPDAVAEAAREVLGAIAARTVEQRLQLLDRLVEAARPINLRVAPVRDSAEAAAVIVRLVREKELEWGTGKSVTAWKHPLIDALNLPEALAGLDVPVYFTEIGKVGLSDEQEGEARERIRREMIDSFIGVTSADFCVAETATLVMKTRPGEARGASLLPSVHVAVIRLEQLLGSLEELYVTLGWESTQREEGMPNCVTLISGPSKTADIEMEMVHGAHGPREMHVCVMLG